MFSIMQQDENILSDMESNALEGEKDLLTSEMSATYVELMQVYMAGEMVLVPVSDVAEVIRLQPLSLVPMAPDHLLGVCNVHGQILCVIDPCSVMNLDGEAAKDSEKSRLVSLRHPVMHLALRVDGVSSLLSIHEDVFLNLPDDTNAFFRGSICVEGKDYRVLNTAALFL